MSTDFILKILSCGSFASCLAVLGKVAGLSPDSIKLFFHKILTCMQHPCTCVLSIISLYCTSNIHVYFFSLTKFWFFSWYLFHDWRTEGWVGERGNQKSTYFAPCHSWSSLSSQQSNFLTILSSGYLGKYELSERKMLVLKHDLESTFNWLVSNHY